jgi:hypothetical protein
VDAAKDQASKEAVASAATTAAAKFGVTVSVSTDGKGVASIAATGGNDQGGGAGGTTTTTTGSVPSGSGGGGGSPASPN